MRVNAVLLCVVLLPALAWGEDFVCGTEADTVDGGLRVYRRSIDPTQAQADCSQVPEVQQAAQRTLVDSTDRRKLRVDTVARLAVLKSQSVRDAIDAADAAAQAETEALITEKATNDVCNTNDLTIIDQKIDNLINPVASLDQAKTAMKIALKKVARCLIASR